MLRAYNKYICYKHCMEFNVLSYRSYQIKYEKKNKHKNNMTFK